MGTLGKRLLFTAGLIMCLFPAACGAMSEDVPAVETPEGLTVTDWTGHTETFASCPQRVVALSGSLGEVWLNAGGTLAGITQDAVSERDLELPETIQVVGTIKEPNTELLLTLEPDFVILSADIAAHTELAATLEELEIPFGLFHEEYFADYLALLEQFTNLTGRADLYEENGLQIQSEIRDILPQTPSQEGKNVLLLRAYSSAFKAKNSDCLAGTMLKDFGLENVLDHYDTLTEDISMEEIMRVDPDYIFVTTMGSDTQAAIDHLEHQLCADSGWSTLTAVKEGRYYILPKELFHYKPNARWAQAYAYLAALFPPA